MVNIEFWDSVDDIPSGSIYYNKLNSYNSPATNSAFLYEYAGGTYNLTYDKIKPKNIKNYNTASSTYKYLTYYSDDYFYWSPAPSTSPFGYSTNFVQRYEGYYFKTYGGSYSDHTYFVSSYSTSGPGIGTSYSWAALICSRSSSNYICEFRNYTGQSSTMAYINQYGSYYTGSKKRIKKKIKKLKDSKNIINYKKIFNKINFCEFEYDREDERTEQEKMKIKKNMNIIKLVKLFKVKNALV